MLVYFFSGPWYTLFTRGETGAGSTVSGYETPRPISDWKFPTLPNSNTVFGADGVDAALFSGSKSYFFKDAYYVRVDQSVPGGTISQDFTEAHPISEWGFCKGFGEKGIDSALWSGPVTYFFKGSEYIRVTRGEDDFGNGCDPGYPKSISEIWDWPGPFNSDIKAALPSGLVDYFFHDNAYIRVSRGIELDGFVNAGYPNYNAHSAWTFPAGFATNGPDAALYSGGAFQPEPQSPLVSGLASNNSYYLGDGGNNLIGVTVTINIDDDLTSSSDGFGFQLNSISQPVSGGQVAALAQQMIIYSPRGTNQLVGRIFHYSAVAGDVSNEVISFDDQVTIATLPAVNTIKGGSSVSLKVQNDPTTGKVTGCTFNYTPAGGSAVLPQTINIADGVLDQTGKPPTLAYMQPIQAFRLDIVADYSTSSTAPYGTAILTGGQGSTSYSASSAPKGLTVYTYNPPYIYGWTTYETANTVYAPLPGGRPLDVSQLWGVAPPVPVDLSGLFGTQPQIVSNHTVAGHGGLPPPKGSASNHRRGSKGAVYWSA